MKFTRDSLLWTEMTSIQYVSKENCDATILKF